MLSTLETSVIFWVTYFEFWLRPCLRSINFPEIRVEYCRSYCVKNVSIRGFSGPYFPTFELNTEISPYSVWLWEIRTTKNLEYGHLLLNVRHLNCSGKEVLKILNYLKQLDTFDTSQIYLRFFFFFSESKPWWSLSRGIFIVTNNSFKKNKVTENVFNTLLGL